MSVSHTADAVIERRKTVTRRLGWRFLTIGNRLALCRKVMGRQPGEPLERLAEVEVIDVRRELLTAITDADVDAEGVPVDVFTPELLRGSPRTHEMTCADCRRANWIGWFARTMGVPVTTEITRIEWRYL